MPTNLSEGWRRLGCSVEEFFYGTHMGKSWSNSGLRTNYQINAQLLSTAKNLKEKGRLDLIFAVIYDDVLTVETAKQLRALDVPMVNYHVDMVGQWYRVLRTGRYFDLLACAQMDHWARLYKAGIRPYYMPMAANPVSTDDQFSKKLLFNGVVYLGSPWVYRRQVLADLTEQGIPVRIYGHNWLRQQSDPSNSQPLRKNIHDIRFYLLPRLREEGWNDLIETLRERLRKKSLIIGGSSDIPSENIKGVYAHNDFIHLVQGAAINLGFTHFKGIPGAPSERRQVRLREFEIPMAGGFYLTQDCRQLRELFEVGKHVEVWNNTADLREKIFYYLYHPDERQEIARAGRAYCLRHHTWENRFRELLEELGMRSNGINKW